MNRDTASGRGGPSVLVTTTTWWPSVAVLASSLERAGFAVTLLCPKGHVGHRGQGFSRRELDRARPLASLADAIRTLSPLLIVPGDDRAAAHLIQLATDGTADVRALVAGSLGSLTAALTDRVALLRAAAEAGLPVPAFDAIRSRGDLRRWTSTIAPPWVLKADGAWGGEGVAIVRDDAEAEAARCRLARRMSLIRASWRAWINGDPFWLQDRRIAHPPQVSAQAFVAGWPGSCALFARDGDVLGATIVEAQATCGAHGPSTLLRAVERPAFLEGARRLVRHLRLSGFVGLDFMVDGATGQAVLIEMNPRITMAARMRGPFGPDPISAAACAFGHVPPAEPEPRDVFASFPLAWLTDPFAPDLACCGDDVPWHEPAILRAALEPLWVESGVLTGMPARLRDWRCALRGARQPPDYRHRPFDWWLKQGVLGPPSLCSVGAAGVGARESDRAHGVRQAAVT